MVTILSRPQCVKISVLSVSHSMGLATDQDNQMAFTWMHCGLMTPSHMVVHVPRSPVWYPAITWTNATLFTIRHLTCLRTNFSEISVAASTGNSTLVSHWQIGKKNLNENVDISNEQITAIWTWWMKMKLQHTFYPMGHPWRTSWTNRWVNARKT